MRAEVDSNQGPSAYQPHALPPGQTGFCVFLYHGSDSDSQNIAWYLEQ